MPQPSCEIGGWRRFTLITLTLESVGLGVLTGTATTRQGADAMVMVIGATVLVLDFGWRMRFMR